MSEKRRNSAAVAESVAAPDGVDVDCVIESGEPRTIGTIGSGGRRDEVFTVQHLDLAAVVSWCR